MLKRSVAFNLHLYLRSPVYTPQSSSYTKRFVIYIPEIFPKFLRKRGCLFYWNTAFRRFIYYFHTTIQILLSLNFCFLPLLKNFNSTQLLTFHQHSTHVKYPNGPLKSGERNAGRRKTDGEMESKVDQEAERVTNKDKIRSSKVLEISPCKKITICSRVQKMFILPRCVLFSFLYGDRNNNCYLFRR